MAAVDFLKGEKVWLSAFGAIGVAIVVFTGRSSSPAASPIVWQELPPSAVAGRTVTKGASSAAIPSELLVEVSGAVKAPGIFRMKPGLRVLDALERAGGLAADAETDRLNRVAELKDGMLIHIPHKAPPKKVALGERRPSKPKKEKEPEPILVFVAKDFPRESSNPPPQDPPAIDPYPELHRKNWRDSDSGPVDPYPFHPGEKKSASAKVSLNRATADELTTLPGVGPSLAADIVAYRERYGRFREIEDLTKVAGIGEAKLEKMRPYLEL